MRHFVLTWTICSRETHTTAVPRRIFTPHLAKLHLTTHPAHPWTTHLPSSPPSSSLFLCLFLKLLPSFPASSLPPALPSWSSRRRQCWGWHSFQLYTELDALWILQFLVFIIWALWKWVGFEVSWLILLFNFMFPVNDVFFFSLFLGGRQGGGKIHVIGHSHHRGWPKQARLGWCECSLSWPNRSQMGPMQTLLGAAALMPSQIMWNTCSISQLRGDKATDVHNGQDYSADEHFF